MKILIWGRSSFDTDGAHKRLIERLGEPLVLVEGDKKDEDLLGGASLIINHDGGVRMPESAWQINTGGTMSNVPPDAVGKPGKINWDTFIHNLESFFQKVKDRSEIAKEDIDTLYAIDPELEKLLEPFATASPLAAKDEVTLSLREAKLKLQARAEDLIIKQRMS